MEQKFPIKKVSIICAKSSIEDVYASLIMGNGAVMEGIEANLFFTFFGMDAITKKRMDKLDIPPVSEFLDLITAGGGKIYACKTAADMFKLKMKDLSEHVIGIITIGEFYELAGGEGSQIIFT
jgi:peroxiredoxin family protein